MMEWNLPKILLETVLEAGDASVSPIRFVPENKTWIFWNETWSEKSQEFQTIDEALLAFKDYCEKYIDIETAKRGNLP